MWVFYMQLSMLRGSHCVTDDNNIASLEKEAHFCVTLSICLLTRRTVQRLDVRAVWWMGSVCLGEA